MRESIQASRRSCSSLAAPADVTSGRELLVEEKALAQAESECLADQEIRARRNERAGERRAELDREYVLAFAARVKEIFPACPAGREQEIAEHACRKFSGRVGRSAAAKSFDEDAVRLAVMAHVRHRETNYDELLGKGCLRREARSRVRDNVERVCQEWEMRNKTQAAKS